MKTPSKTLLLATLLILASGSCSAGLLESLALHGIEKAGKKFADARGQPTAAAVLPAGKGVGFQGCPNFFPKGMVPVLPAGAKSWGLRELCFDNFAILHSAASRTAVYAVERLNARQIAEARDEARTDVFFADARLPAAERSELSDFVGSGLDRGHLAAAGNQNTQRAMAQSFSLANMVPQAPENNRKTWRNVEMSTRKFVLRSAGDVYVFTGPAFVSDVTYLKKRVAVPSHLYKLVYDESTNRAWAYWIANTNEARMSAPISYEEFTARIGIEFLPGIRPQH